MSTSIALTSRDDPLHHSGLPAADDKSFVPCSRSSDTQCSCRHWNITWDRSHPIHVQGQVGWGPGQPGLVLDMEVGSPACGGGCWSLVILEVPSIPSHSMILWFYEESSLWCTGWSLSGLWWALGMQPLQCCWYIIFSLGWPDGCGTSLKLLLLCKGHDIQLAINSDEYLYNINGEISGFPWWKCDIGIFFKINLNKVRIFYPLEKISRLIK